MAVKEKIRIRLKGYDHNLVDKAAEMIVEAGLAKQVKDGIKVLGNGNLEKNLTVQAHKFSKTAIEKIEAAGGKAEVL